MKEWICKVCGYTHHGEEAPDKCPQCGAPKPQFHLKGNRRWNYFNIFIIVVLLTTLIYGIYACHATRTVDDIALLP